MKSKVFHKKGLWEKIKSSRLIIMIGFILIIVVSFSLSKEISRKYRINREIKEIEDEVAKLEEKNQELTSLIEYLKTDSFKEIQARQQLGLQKEGEVAVSIKSAPSEISEKQVNQELGNQIFISNPRKWWNYFFQQ